MIINWCKILGHKWVPVYIIGYFGKIKVKFIGAECERCDFGEDDLGDTLEKMSSNPVNTYNEKYYK